MYTVRSLLCMYTVKSIVYVYSQDLHFDCALGTLHAMNLTQNLSLQGAPAHLTTLNMTTILLIIVHNQL